MDIVSEISRRRSYRSFQNQPVESEKMELIMQAGLLAPTGMNRQSTQFIHLKNPSIQNEYKELYEKINGRPQAYYNAPEIILVLAKKEGSCYVYDGSLALGYMMIEAVHLGVDTCWIHHVKEVFETPQGRDLLKKWGIDDANLEGIGSLILGYGNCEPRDKNIIAGRIHILGEN